jgi:DNA mismatch repair ATPase MutS
VPLAGVPHYVLEKHLATFISRGHRVAICEQTSAAPVKGKDGKKLIQRDVVRVVTAGTIIEPQLLDSKTIIIWSLLSATAAAPESLTPTLRPAISPRRKSTIKTL